MPDNKGLTKRQHYHMRAILKNFALGEDLSIYYKDGRTDRVAGIVTCRQRPGSASGVMFISLEDETGTTNIVVWSRVQEQFRSEILTGRLLIIKGIFEMVTENVRVPIKHVIAGHIQNVTDRLESLSIKPRSFH